MVNELEEETGDDCGMKRRFSVSFFLFIEFYSNIGYRQELNEIPVESFIAETIFTKYRINVFSKYCFNFCALIFRDFP